MYLPLLGALFAPPRVSSHAAAPRTRINKRLTFVRSQRYTLLNDKKIANVFYTTVRRCTFSSSAPTRQALKRLQLTPSSLATWEELPCFECLYCLRLHSLTSLLRRLQSPCLSRDMMIIFLKCILSLVSILSEIVEMTAIFVPIKKSQRLILRYIFTPVHNFTSLPLYYIALLSFFFLTS